MPNSNNSPLFSPLGSEFIPSPPPEGEKRQCSYYPYLEDKVSSVKTASMKNGCKCCFEQKKRAVFGRAGWGRNSPIRTPCNLGTKQRSPPTHPAHFLGLYPFSHSHRKVSAEWEGHVLTHCYSFVLFVINTICNISPFWSFLFPLETLWRMMALLREVGDVILYSVSMLVCSNISYSETSERSCAVSRPRDKEWLGQDTPAS